MLRSLRDWVDDRTGYRRVLAPIRSRVLPGGASWPQVTASCLLWFFVVELVTGLLLMTTYSPSMASAWASVDYIDQAYAGAFVRGLHYWGAQALVILFAAHTVRILVSGAFRAPRELIWISGLLLIPLFAVWAVTGNPLDGSQKGLAQIEVEGNIIGSTPVIGPVLQRILIGGVEVGNLTLTRLYSLHVGLLPLGAGLLLVLHISQVYRHGPSPPRRGRPSQSLTPYWPYQSVRNMTALAVLLGVVAVLAWRYGAPLNAPADPELSHTPRPEWYFLFLFELRRYFVGPWEFVATVVLPSAILVVLLSVPLLDRVCSERMSAALRYLAVVLGMAAWFTLTTVSVMRDRRDEGFMATVARSKQFAARARVLADHGQIPPEGAVALLREDPKIQGPLLFEQHCATCHSHADEQGKGITCEDPSASNLHRFGSVHWLAGLLDPETIKGPDYFGNTAFADGEMASTITDMFDGLDTEEKQELRDQLRKVAAVLAAEAAQSSGHAPDENADGEVIAAGRELLTGDLGCVDCHRFHDDGELGAAPDLTGYGSREWLLGMISDPQHERFYGDRNDRMPVFAAEPDQRSSNLLTQRELGLLVDWLRGEWYEPETAK